MSTQQEVKQRSLQTSPGTTEVEVGTGFKVHEPFSYLLAKRIFDLVVSLSALVFLIPIIPVLAVMIKLDTPGPVFFKQDRVGKNGKLFKFFKFRSMQQGADRQRKDIESLNEQDGPIFKVRTDPRITSVGRFLRRSSLDEIPQVFNVVRGDMSIVGPRPPLPSEVENYQPWHLRRLEVTPGITCFWQISGRSQLSFNEWMRLDMAYIKHRSFKTDLTIFLKTIPAVIARKGAY